MKINPLAINGLNTIKSENVLEETTNSFKEIFNSQIDQLNQLQTNSDQMIEQLITGESEDIHSVLIAAEEAKLALETTIQLRNKVIDAYKEVINMQL